MKAIIIEVDAFKEKVPGYDSRKAHLYHRRSAKLADDAFKKALKESDYERAILMCGGSASGKSEFDLHLNLNPTQLSAIT